MKEFVYYTKDISYKSFFDKSENKKRYFVQGHITSGDLDLVNDIITKGCLDDIDKQLKSRTIKLDFDHETLRKSDKELEDDVKYNITKIPLGKAVKSYRDEKGNVVEFELNSNWKKFDAKSNVVMTFKEIWEDIKNGYYDSFSIAYSIPKKPLMKAIGDIQARILDKVNLINVALTGNPINPYATMTNVFAKSLTNSSDTSDLHKEIEELKNKLGDIMKEQKSEIKEEVIANEEVAVKSETAVEEQPEEVESTPEATENTEVKSTENVEVKSEPVVEEKSEAVKETKDYVEAKSFNDITAELKSKIEVLEKSIEKIDALLNQPVNKGIGTESKSEIQSKSVPELKSDKILDLI